MSSVPYGCPNCGSTETWRPVAVNKKGLSAGKALVGGVLAGPVGAIVGGVIGKKYTTWACSQCGFMCEYEYRSNDENNIGRANTAADGSVSEGAIAGIIMFLTCLIIYPAFILIPLIIYAIYALFNWFSGYLSKKRIERKIIADQNEFLRSLEKTKTAKSVRKSSVSHVLPLVTPVH